MLVIDHLECLVQLVELLVDRRRLVLHPAHVHVVEQGVEAVSHREERLAHLLGIHPAHLELRDPPRDPDDARLGSAHGVPDRLCPVEAVAAGAALLVDEGERRLHHLVVTVAGDAGRSPSAERAAVGACQVILVDAGVAAPAKGGDVLFLRRPQKAALRAHGVRRVLRVPAVAAVAGDAVFRVDAAAPEVHRRPEPVRHGTVTLDADRLRLFRGDSRGRFQEEKRGQEQDGQDVFPYHDRCPHTLSAIQSRMPAITRVRKSGRFNGWRSGERSMKGSSARKVIAAACTESPRSSLGKIFKVW